MNLVWQKYLGAAGARFDASGLRDFGDLPSELLAARDGTVVSPLLHLALTEFSGEDAPSFLHNQLTSDVNHLPIDVAQHAAWCSSKGRMQASLLLYRSELGIQALIASDLLEASIKRLQMFVLRSRVKISDLTQSHGILGIAGPQAEQALRVAELPVPESDMAKLAFAAGFVIRLSASRFILVAELAAAAAIWKKLSTIARPAGPQVWQWLDVQAGIPLITAATKEAFVPQMANFDAIGGVSFNKGCYPGQEVVARARYLGKVKRHLYRIHAAAAFTAGTSLFAPPASPDQPCGLVVSAVPAPGGGYDALAVIQESFVEGEDKAGLDEAGEGMDSGLRLELPAGEDLAVEKVERVLA